MNSRPDSSPLLSRKRSHNGELINNGTKTPEVFIDPPTSTTVRQSSPALSISSSGSALTDLNPSNGRSPAPPTSGGSAQKKLKLTFAEREVERAVKKGEKEEREKQKAEEKAKREQEKREKEEEREAAKRQRELEKAQKDAGKAKKDAEKTEKQKVKDAEKAKKEAEKAKKEAEKLKKERVQMRLGNFFTKPAQASTPPSIPEDVSSGVSSRRSSVTTMDVEMPDAQLKSTRAIDPEFRKWFLPFYIDEKMEVAPANRFLSSQHTLVLSDVDRLLEAHQKSLDLEKPQVLKEKLEGYHRRAQQGRRFVSVKQLIAQIEGTETTPIDLNSDRATATSRQILANIPMKILSYSVDVRPPYQGTFTREVSPKTTRRISRRPYARLLPDVNYKYDSEAEWEPPEEGDEDLNSEDEDGSIDNDDEEMDDFLDDADDVAKRRMIVGDVEPVSTGLCWQGQEGAIESSMKQYHMDVIDDAHLPFPIDPFSTQYWGKSAKPSPVKVEKKASTVTVTTMQAPRLPLASVSANTTIHNGQGGFISASLLPITNQDGENASLPVPKQNGKAPDPNKPLKLISPDLLPAFKQAIEGKVMTKIGLIEILKKDFPRVPKDVIKDTLGAVAQRAGKKADDRWVLL